MNIKRAIAPEKLREDKTVRDPMTHEAAQLLKAVADPNRLRIIKCLQFRPACVCELVQATGMPQPRISRHLRTLRDAGLVEDRRDAQWVEYTLADAAPNSLCADLITLVCGWLEDSPQTIADREKLALASRESCQGIAAES